MQKISPFLWFDTQAEEAANLYVSVFPNSRVLSVSRYPENGPGKPGSAMTVSFELDGTRFTALNAGPQFKFNESVSFVVECDNQEEVDKYWHALTANGGQESACGWLKDRFGLSWQITPKQLLKAITDPDRARAQRAMASMMTMRKINIAEIERAAKG